MVPHIFSFKVLQNYEVANNSVTTNDDIIAHANQEKEKMMTSSADDEITSNIIIFPAVRDLFGSSVKKVNKRIDKAFKRAFLNLRKRDQVLAESDKEIDEWDKLRSKAPTIAKEAGDGEWQVLVNDEESSSFLRLENTRCDGRVMVSEVKL